MDSKILDSHFHVPVRACPWATPLDEPHRPHCPIRHLVTQEGINLLPPWIRYRKKHQLWFVKALTRLLKKTKDGLGLTDPGLHRDLWDLRPQFFVFREGEEWRLHRSVMNQVLLKEDHKYYMDCCQGAADATVDRLQTVSKDGEVLNLEDVLYRWAVECKFLLSKNPLQPLYQLFLFIAVSSVLLGKNYGPSWNKIAPIIAKLTTVMRDVFEATAVIETYPVRIAQLLGLKAWKDFEKAEDAALPCGKYGK